MKEITLRLEDKEMKKLNSWFSFYEISSKIESLAFYSSLVLAVAVFATGNDGIISKGIPIGITLCLLNIVFLNVEKYFQNKLDKVDVIMNACMDEAISNEEAVNQLEELLKNE